MKKLMCMAALAIATGVSTIAVPATAQDSVSEDANPHYSVETTTIGVLLDDPQSAAILERLIPTVYANDLFQTIGRPNTLRTAAQYESAVLTEEKMAEIQAEFDKLASQETAGEAQ